MYSNVSNKYSKFDKTKISYIFEKTLSLPIVYSKCDHEHKTIFKEESIKQLKILDLIDNTEEHQKISNMPE